MNILFVAGTLTGRGGIETCLRSVAQEGRANGDSVRILALAPSSQDTSWHQGLDYSEVEKGPKSLKKQMIRGLPAIVKACRAHPPDAVVVIYSSTIPLVRMALFLAGMRRPVVSWLHFAMAHKQRTNLLRFAHGHLAISSEIAENTKQMPGVAQDSVHLVYNGAPLDTATPVPRSSKGPLRLLYVGRLMAGRQKQTDDLLTSLAGVKGDWQLDLIGAGDQDHDIPQLQALAERLGIAERLRWHGRRTDPWRAADAADVLVLCSAFEGFPMVLIEAMARGIPCLSSDCPSGPADIIQPGLNGWLFPNGDKEAMTRELEHLVTDRGQLPPTEDVRASVSSFSSTKVFQRIRSALDHTIIQLRGVAS